MNNSNNYSGAGTQFREIPRLAHVHGGCLFLSVT